MQGRDGAAQGGGREARGHLPAPGGGRGVGRQDRLPGEQWQSSRSLAESESHTHARTQGFQEAQRLLGSG